MAFGSLAPDSQRPRRRILDHFRQGYGPPEFQEPTTKARRGHACQKNRGSARGAKFSQGPAGIDGYRHPGSRARLAFGLLLYTAHRRGDVVPLGPQDIQDGFIRVRRQKTGAITEIPVLPELQEILSAHPVDNKTLLMTSGGKPFTAAGFKPKGKVPK